MAERLLPKQDVAGSSPVSRLCEFAEKFFLHTASSGSRTQVAKGPVCKTVITSSILVGSFHREM